MIEINLLPESLREVESTPFPRMIAILVGVTLFLIVSYFVASEYFNVIIVLKDKKTSIDDFVKSDVTIKSLKRVKDLEKEIAEKRQRKDILTNIVGSKIMWSKKLDEFNKLVHEKFPNKLWFDSVDISSTQKIDFAKSNSPIIMKMIAKGHLMLTKEDNYGASVSELQTQLKSPENAFGENIDQKKFKIPSWTRTDNAEINKVIVDFPLEVYFLPKTFLSTEVPKVKKQ